MDVHTPRLIATVSYLYLKHMDSSLGLEGILTYPINPWESLHTPPNPWESSPTLLTLGNPHSIEYPTPIYLLIP